MSFLAKPYRRLFIRKFEIEALLHLQLNSDTVLNSHLKKIYKLLHRVALGSSILGRCTKVGLLTNDPRCNYATDCPLRTTSASDIDSVA